MLTISVLGPLVIQASGRPIKLPRKARALLVYLAMHEDRMPRDQLADLLWPFQDSEQARHSLRNCLLELRKASDCASTWLGGDFGHCWVTDVTLDLTRFERLHRSTDRFALQEACDTHRGEFLQGFELQSEPWGEWVDRKRSQLQDRLVEALARLSELCSAAGEHTQAIAAARRLVSLDLYGERSHRRLLRALASDGRRNEAVQHYRQFERDLRRELDVRPDLKTQRLFREILGDCSLPVGAPPEVRPPRPTSPAPALLTERLERLATELRAAVGGTAKLSRRLVNEASEAMFAAAAERRNAAAGPVVDCVDPVSIDQALTRRLAAVDRAAA